MKKLCAVLLCLTLAVSLAGATLAEDCQHESRHPVTVMNYDYPIYSLDDLEEPDVYHWVTYEAWQYGECDACGERFSGRPLPEEDVTELQEHTFVDGVCACGYAAPVIKGVVSNEVGRETVKVNARPVNDRLHIWDVVDGATGKKIGTAIQEHYYESGICQDCGHANGCSHPQGKEVTESDYSFVGEMVSGMDITQTYHKYTVDRAGKRVYCGVCGEYLSEKTFGQTVIQEPHDFDGSGECSVCGYHNTCAHARTRVESHPESMQGIRVRNIGDANVHQLWGDWIQEETFCAICGQFIDSREYDGASTATESHDFDDNGVCRICGYPQSPVESPADTDASTAAATATAAPTATPEPGAYVPVATDIATHGVKASDDLTAVAAMETVGQTLAGEGASVSVPAFEQILSSDELRRYNALSVDERLLVALAALGYGNSSSLGADAQSLAADIAARLGRMDASHMQEVMDIAVTSTTVTVNGQPHDAVRLEVVVREGSSQTRERYTFYDDNGLWRLYGVEVWR